MSMDFDWLTQTFRKDMLRFAYLHIQPIEDAEEAVQETFYALIEKQDTLDNVEHLRAYVFATLKYKILDCLRQRYRDKKTFATIEAVDEIDTLIFNDQGHWQAEIDIHEWRTPANELEMRYLLEVLDICINQLPHKIAQVFSMKEFLACESSEICAVLNITKDDYWQCMSRARKRLQLCLDHKWYTT